MPKVRIVLRGHFQCSPDKFDAHHRTVVVDSEELFGFVKEGYNAVGSEIETSENDGKKFASTNTQSKSLSNESKEFIENLFRSQVDLPPDIVEAVNEHFWDLL